MPRSSRQRASFCLPIAIAREAVIADALEASRQHMEQEAADEFLGREGHCSPGSAVAIVLPAEANLAIVDGEQAVVGNGDAMRVASQVVEDLLRSGEGRLGVNHPFGSAQRG